MILIALLVPVLMMLLMLAMEAFEDFLFRPPEAPPTPIGGADEPSSRSGPKSTEAEPQEDRAGARALRDR
ncbi:hypothetical protein FE633_39320 [Streptomyces montanus]|uniref:Uncharacterized protein n=1 Tax=Streptomyces montanus TaxID=2580423 RepID=A0A5R9FFF4_9ACTN|nr:hypothetical protein [Streptomyces montanus]TLS40890.1 hypothetical protein FE633_39320 [Streptomyces montanus]